MKKANILLSAAMLLSTALFAQNNENNIIFVVKDENNAPMEFATVVALSLPDSTILCGGITDELGLLDLALPEEAALVQISMVGYSTAEMPVQGLAGTNTVRLHPDAAVLEGAVLSVSLPKTGIKGDAVVTNITGSVLEHSGNALDVLGKVPGMIDKNGKLEVIGRGVPVYYINGRKVTDPTELRNLMSEDIRSVEVVNNPGAAYGGDVFSVVRISTVKRQGDGLSFALSSQMKQRIYRKRDFDPSWSVLDLNYRRLGVDIFGKLVYWNHRSYQFSDIYTGVFTKNTNTVRENSQSGWIDGLEHSGGFQGVIGANWQINDNHSVGIKLDNGIGTIGDGRMTLDYDVFSDGVLTDRIKSITSSMTSQNTSFNGNLYYDGTLDKVHINFNGDFTRGIYNNARDAREESLKSPVVVISSTQAQTSLGAAKLVVSFPLWKGVFQTGVEETFVKAQQEYLIDKTEIPSSNAYILENTLAGFAEYGLTLPFGQINAGLRYEHVTFGYHDLAFPANDRSRVHDNFFPSLSFSTTAGSVNINLSYTGKTLRPQFDQLTNEVRYINRFTYDTGDPLLESETHRTLALNVNRKWLTFSGTYTKIENSIFQKVYPYGEEGVVVIKYSNADSPLHKLNLYLNASSELGVWIPNYTLGMQKQFFSMEVTDPRAAGGSRTVSFNNPMFIIQANNAFRIKHDWLLNLDYQYISPFGQMNVLFYKPMNTLNFSVSKSFLRDGALNVKLSWTDILNSSVMCFTADYGNAIFNRSIDEYKPCIQLTMSYRFNAAGSKYRGTGAGLDVKERIK